MSVLRFSFPLPEKALKAGRICFVFLGALLFFASGCPLFAQEAGVGDGISLVPARIPEKDGSVAAYRMAYTPFFSREDAATLLRARTAMRLAEAAAAAIARRTGFEGARFGLAAGSGGGESGLGERWADLAVAETVASFSFSKQLRSLGDERGTCSVMGRFSLPEKGLAGKITEILRQPDLLEALCIAIKLRTEAVEKLERGLGEATSPGKPALSKQEIRQQIGRLISLEWLFPRLAELAKKDQGAPGAMLTGLDRELARDPCNPLLLYLQGKSLMAEKPQAKAIDAYSSCLDRYPGFGAALFERGMAFMKLHLHELAAADFSAAIGLRPAARFFIARGAAERKMGNLASMCSDYREACALGRCQEYGWAREHGYCGQDH